MLREDGMQIFAQTAHIRGQRQRLLTEHSAYPSIAKNHTMIADQLYNQKNYFEAFLEYKSALESLMLTGGSGHLLAFLVLFKLLMIKCSKLSPSDYQKVDSLEDLMGRFKTLLSSTVFCFVIIEEVI